MPGFKMPDVPECKDIQGGAGPGSSAGATIPMEVARTHRYKVEIYNVNAGTQDSSSVTFYASKVTRPILEIDRITIHHGQDEIYRPGKQRWQPVDITFYDVIEGSSVLPSKFLCEWRKDVVNFQKSRVVGPSVLLREVQISMLDENGSEVWLYKLIGAWPMNVSPSTLAFSDSSLAETTVKISYNKLAETCDDGNSDNGHGSQNAINHNPDGSIQR